MPHHQNRDRSSAPSQRALRAGELVRHALAEILARGEVHDPVIETHLITEPFGTMFLSVRWRRPTKMVSATNFVCANGGS